MQRLQGRRGNCDRRAGGNCLRAAQAPTISLDPSRLPRLGTIDPQFQSYNVEMIEVTGGRFWKPYRARASTRGADNSGDIPAGMDPGLYAYREPIDLSNPRLRTLAAALAPAYVRVSGTWANTTYFAENDETSATPPNGFSAVLRAASAFLRLSATSERYTLSADDLQSDGVRLNGTALELGPVAARFGRDRTGQDGFP